MMLHNRIDRTGQRFGRLLVIKYVSGNDWLCRCGCGTDKTVSSRLMTSGNTHSCGCLKRETARMTGKAQTTHGMAHTRPFKIWDGMRDRCYNPKNKDYARYGGAGIKIEWASFSEFWNDMAAGYRAHLQIDRRNGELGYSKSNCRWATVKEQQRNRKSNVTIPTPQGPMLLIEAAETFGINYGALKMRYRTQGPVLDILRPYKPRKQAA